MTRGFSLYLDALRFLAALVVFASHMGYERFTNGNMQWIRDLNLGSDAVVVFFVLSGFVIAYTTLTKDRGPAAYAEARFARLYSVVIPALVFTFALDGLGNWLMPHAYEGWWYNGVDQLGQFLRALTFTTQVWTDTTRVGSNGPFWSVAYEAWYYAGFGVAVFCRGRTRILVLALMALLVGPRVLLLAPCWLLGVALQQLVTRGHAASLSGATAWLLALAPWALYAGALALNIPTHLTQMTYQLLGEMVTPNALFGFSDEFIWNFLIALLIALHFLGVYSLARNADWLGARMETAIRWSAGATFSLYLFHYPILTFLHGLPVYDSASPLHAALMAAVALAACFALAEVSERRLGAWKRLVHGMFEKLSPKPASLPQRST